MTRHHSPAGVRLHSSVGCVRLGKQVIVHGKDLHVDCLDMSFVQYLLFCVTGRRVSSAQARVLEGLWVGTGYPDPRIWCNRVAGYLGSARVDPGLAMSAALAASNSVEYGFLAQARAFELQSRIPEPSSARQHWLDERLHAGAAFPGYGRPLTRSDERIAAALHVLVREGQEAGPALHRAFWLRKELLRERQLDMNILAVWGAVALDFGLEKGQYEAFMTLMYYPGYAAVYCDQRGRPAMSFLAGYQTQVVPVSPPDPPSEPSRERTVCAQPSLRRAAELSRKSRQRLKRSAQSLRVARQHGIQGKQPRQAVEPATSGGSPSEIAASLRANATLSAAPRAIGPALAGQRR